MLIFTFNKCVTRKHCNASCAVLHFAVKLNCLVKIILCLDGCANCFENKYIALEKSFLSIEKNCKFTNNF